MPEKKLTEENYSNLDIAIIGMACRFPGANNTEEFWNNLVNGVESIKRLSDEEILQSGVDPSYLTNPAYVKASPVIEGPGLFDAKFFGYAPSEAMALDPQHRILLTCAYESLENAGYDPDKFNGRIGVYTGSAMNTYFMNTGLNEKFVDEYIPTLIGNDKDFLSTRISYKLNLKGPSINVQTACSTSLVAIHLACQSLLSEESDMALAGAVSVKAPHNAGYIYDGGGVVSPDGHVRAFDAKANGTVFGSGAGIIVLKRLSDAIKDRDNILAVIKGSAINNDGSAKVGYTAPGIGSQADVVIEAISISDIDPESISYIETHGSGTPVGDPIEITALTKAFRAFTDKNNFCAIGSVKTNIGHLDAAAGIAGVIKTVLSLKHRKIPASLHYEIPNPEIDFPNTPFYVNSGLKEWNSDSKRIAGVMSTGMGGTNAHIIIEEAPETKDSTASDLPALFILSAKKEEVLENTSRQLLDFFVKNDQVNLKNAAYTLQKGRKTFDYRKFFVAKDREFAIKVLSQEKSKSIVSAKYQNSSRRPVIFLFPGIGDHYVGMGYDLYENVSVFKAEVDKCAGILQKYLNVDIRDILYPKNYKRIRPADDGGIDLKKMLESRVNKSPDPDTERLNQTIYAQPALFTMEYALAKLWMHLGITPDAIVGHSMGEYVAACLSGVFSLDDSLKLISKRAALVNSLPKGGMISISLSESELLPFLTDGLSISLINSPNLCVVAGDEEKVNEFERVLIDKEIQYRHVQNSHAFHTKMMDPIFDAFLAEVNQVKLNPPGIPYTSNITGKWISESEATDPVYWAKHTKSTARFSDALEKAWQIKNCVLLEVGPGNTLSVLAMQHPESRKSDNPVTISSLRADYNNQFDLNYLLTGIGKLWLSGIEIDWEKLYEGEKPKRITLPAYPFEGENYWIQKKPSEKSQQRISESKKNDFKDWFYVPSWKRSSRIGEINQNISSLKNSNWLIFSSGSEFENSVIKLLDEYSCKRIVIKKGSGFSVIDEQNIQINHQNEQEYELLFKELEGRHFRINNILHFWNFSISKNFAASIKELDSSLFDSIYSLLFISKNLKPADTENLVNAAVITNNLFNVLDYEDLTSPEKSMVIGPSKVINKEINNLFIKCIDFSTDDTSFNKLAPRYLLSEFLTSDKNEIVAYRGNYRWLQTIEKINIESSETPIQTRTGIIKPGGVYLLTGGTGGLGLIFAEHFARQNNVNLILTKRFDFPEKSSWQNWLEENKNDNKTSPIINKLREIEALGSRVEVRVCDIAEEQETRSLINQIKNEFGRIDGVIHIAGIIDDGLIVSKTPDSVKRVLDPKVHGTFNLYENIELEKLDFFILFSSINSFLAPAGQIDYSSANNYLDSFANFFQKNSKAKIYTINWPGWKENGILANLQVRHGMEKWKQQALDKAIMNSEGIKAFSLILDQNYSQVIVSPENI